MILVTGDVVLDHNIYAGERLEPTSQAKISLHHREELGGAWISYSILDEIRRAVGPFFTSLNPDFPVSFGLVPPSAAQLRPVRRLNYGSLWKFTGVSGAGGCWRQNQVLGYGGGKERPSPVERAPVEPTPTVLVIDDGSLGFRDQSSASLWPACLSGKPSDGPEWLILKMSRPLASGDLWRRLIDGGWGKKIIVVVSADQLRSEGLRVAGGLSWETTVDDIMDELRTNHSLRELRLCRNLIVTMHSDAALWIEQPQPRPESTGNAAPQDASSGIVASGDATSREATDGAVSSRGQTSEASDGNRCQLVFDREHCEGEFETTNPAWKAYGFQSAVTASVAWFVRNSVEEKRRNARFQSERELFQETTKRTSEEVEQFDKQWGPQGDPTPTDCLDLTIALSRGLAATRFLLRYGHGADIENPAFPFASVARHIVSAAANRENYATAEVRCGCDVCRTGVVCDRSRRWTILGKLSPWHSKQKPPKLSYEPARKVAVHGPNSLPGVPCAKFGKLQTFDRNEIDSLRKLRQLMLMYRDNPGHTNPLSIAVFGKPGSGKSFGLKQIAKGVFGEKCPLLEFNLSQFRDEDLIGALHQVRDKALAGSPPVVFWDEFDCDEYHWLKYFLAPMQDGAFQEGQITHPVGRAVFVFAGGVNHSSDQIRSLADNSDSNFKAKKGPDFVSRISEYLDVAGPNQRDDTDLEFPVRRAMVIRIALGLGEGETLRIEHGLLTALLGVKEYRNGARSLEKLVTYIREYGGFPLRRAYLPQDDVLGLFVDPVEGEKGFLDLAAQYAGFYAQAEALAPILHRDWFDRMKAKGETNENYVEWNDLKPDIQQSNIAQALRIPEILDLAGLALEEGAADSPDFAKIPPEKLEEMAVAEHGGWEEQKRIEGWSFSLRRDASARRHNLLVNFNLLPEKEQEKDRETIARYPEYARRAGYHIVPAPGART